MKKTKLKLALLIGITSIAALPMMASPGVSVNVQAPGVSVTYGAVPETYVYDGSEYVGCVGNQYYYLNSHKCWVPMDRTRLARFQSYQKAHADWRTHATRNMNYRHDANGHAVPLQGDQKQYQH